MNSYEQNQLFNIAFKREKCLLRVESVSHLGKIFVFST